MTKFSTPIGGNNGAVNDKRFRHLDQNFLDPRSPSENIARTPITFKSSDNTSIPPPPPTPILLNDEPFRENFEHALSKISFDSCLDDEDEVDKNGVLETHFDLFTENIQDDLLTVPIKPQALLALQSELDPRSPTVGIERTPLAFSKTTKEVDAPLIEIEDKERENVFVNSPQMKPFGTPQFAANQVLQVRTPLSCVANKPKRLDLNGKMNSPLLRLRTDKENNDSPKSKKSSINSEATPRKFSIRS